MSRKPENLREIVFEMETDIRDMKVLAEMFYKYTSPAELEDGDHEALSYLTGKFMSAANRTDEAYDRLFKAAAEYAGVSP